MPTRRSTVPSRTPLRIWPAVFPIDCSDRSQQPAATGGEYAPSAGAELAPASSGGGDYSSSGGGYSSGACPAGGGDSGAATIDRIGATIARSTNGSPLRALAEEVPARDRPGAQRDRTTGPRLKEPPQHIPGVDELSPPKSDSEGERRHGGDDQPHRIALDDGQGRTRHGAVRSVRWPTMSTNPRPSHARTTAARPSG